MKTKTVVIDIVKESAMCYKIVLGTIAVPNDQSKIMLAGSGCMSFLVSASTLHAQRLAVGKEYFLSLTEVQK